jgi:outer membrane protein assembly factor BamB
MNHRQAACVLGLLFALSCNPALALQTENTGMRALPAPGAVAVDGKLDDWDLSGGIFACDEVVTMRDRFGLWLFLMYDAQHLYIAAHFLDESPMNNPGQTIGDYGFAGDSLQVRFFTGATAGRDEGESPKARVSHWTCWHGRDNRHVMDIAYGQRFNQGAVKDAQAEGAKQAFQKDADGKGYVQEIAIPWKLITKGGVALQAGDKFVVTFEPNFTVGGAGRLSVKDNFKPAMSLDRVFTFMGPACWGWATCSAQGKVAPQPVRMADGREFPVRLENGHPVVNWTGLVVQKELPGFKEITFSMPADGYISLNLFGPDGSVACQLLRMAFYTKGEHTVKWDGLTTPSYTMPGKPVEPGEYTWSALCHTGIGLRLKGWACNGGNAPWDGPTGKENWGGDHGLPASCAADGERVFLGWSGAEAGKALLACDLQGNVLWKNNRQGMAGAERVAVDGGIVYAVNWGPEFAEKGPDGKERKYSTNYIYRLNAKDGSYSSWEGTNDPDLHPRALWPKPDAVAPECRSHLDGLDAKGGKVYISFAKANTVMVVDGKSGKLLKTVEMTEPRDLCAVSDTLVYVVCGAKEVRALDPTTGQSRVFVALPQIHGVTVEQAGKVYVSVREPDQQVKVFTPDGKQAAEIGRKGGRAKIGPWTPDGMLEASELCLDAKGQLWVMESDSAPKRVSVWDAASGKFVKEFFGPSSYGALGGAINPLDPNLMVGQGCEWRLDPQTGRAACLGTITRDGMENSRFGVGANGRLYLAVASNWAFNIAPLKLLERLGDGQYKLRTVIYYADAAGNEIGATGHGQNAKAAKTMVWADANDDGQRQADEIAGADGELKFSGWYMNCGPDLSLYCGDRQFKVTGFTGCGAPKYDLANPVKMPIPGLGSADGTLVLRGGEYGESHTQFTCGEIAAGRVRWTYPDNFVGVHGSHRAPPPAPGLIRGSFGPCGTAKLPAPIGNVWVMPTNVGEWHILTERGFYLTGLFQGDPMKVAWPEKAGPGAVLDNCPPGLGGEDFGGSICLAKDGQIYVQAGKTGFWNIQVVGLDTVKELPGGKVAIAADDVTLAQKLREEQLQTAAGTQRAKIVKKTVALKGNFDDDFKDCEPLTFKKTAEAEVRVKAAWDDTNLYLAWNVRDQTPWTNVAPEPAHMYFSGDTVDFQIGADPKADPKRTEAARGDLRLSIGPFQGQPTAVIFRKVWDEKKPKTFSSGVVKEYVMDHVAVVAGAQVQVRKEKDRYVVEAALPLEALGLKPAKGLVLRGDFGATHGDPAGQRTRLRTYWSNQHTGIVDDVVFELQLEPKNWGELIFEE